MKVLHRLLLVAVAWWLRQEGATTVAGDCAHACGGVSVPYPFGLEPPCARSPDFLLQCNTSEGSREQLLLETTSGPIPIRKISVRDSTMVVSLPEVYDCYNETGYLENRSSDLFINLNSNPQYRLSDTRNNLTVLGCDTYAFMSDQNGTVGSGCMSLCSEPVDFAEESSCSGVGCCQQWIPKGLKTLRIKISSMGGHLLVSQFNPCGVAFVGDREAFNISTRTLPNFNDLGKRANLTLDWMIEWDVTCIQARSSQSSYACGINTDCRDFVSGPGYRCFCEHGYEGNPYNTSHGCEDIDECKDPEKYPCYGKCKNKPGSYTCLCRFGMQSNGKGRCQIARWVVIILAIILAIPTTGGALAAFYTCWRRWKEENFRRNGGELLKHHRVQIFTKSELAKATNNYDNSNKLGEGGFGSVYRGRITGNIVVAVKKPKDMHKSLIKGDFQHELEIVMQINHKNVVKLHGICLETRIPLLVYEYISNGTLFQHIHHNASTILRSWKNRLRIAAEVALALEYMHSCAEPPIIHGDIKSVNILLDHNYSVKVSDFGTSVLISPEHSHVVANEIQGTLGYIDPEYLTTGMLTVKSDVYSFGVVIVELLTGKKPTSFITNSGESINIIHYFISSVKDKTVSDVISFKDASEDEMDRVGRVAEIAVKCLDQSGARRPAMGEVAEQLVKINRELDSSTVEENKEEIESEVDEKNLYSHATSINSKMSQCGTSASLF